jgi:predicted nucleotidyltransferase
MVQANTNHPLFQPMRDLVMATYGPEPVLRDLMNTIGGIDQAYIYGSWAKRRSGSPGHFPHDVDVLVVGNPDRADTIEASLQARETTGLETNIHIVTSQSWNNPTSVFLKNIKKEPLIQLFPIPESEPHDTAA